MKKTVSIQGESSQKTQCHEKSCQKNPCQGCIWVHIILAGGEGMTRISCAWQGGDGPDAHPRAPRLGVKVRWQPHWPISMQRTRLRFALHTQSPPKRPDASVLRHGPAAGAVDLSSHACNGCNCFLKFSLENGTATPEFCLLHEKRAQSDWVYERICI